MASCWSCYLTNYKCSFFQRWSGHLKWRRRIHQRTLRRCLVGPPTPSAPPPHPHPANGATTWAPATPSTHPDLPPLSPLTSALQRPAWGALSCPGVATPTQHRPDAQKSPLRCLQSRLTTRPVLESPVLGWNGLKSAWVVAAHTRTAPPTPSPAPQIDGQSWAWRDPVSPLPLPRGWMPICPRPRSQGSRSPFRGGRSHSHQSSAKLKASPGGQSYPSSNSLKARCQAVWSRTTIHPPHQALLCLPWQNQVWNGCSHQSRSCPQPDHQTAVSTCTLACFYCFLLNKHTQLWTENALMIFSFISQKVELSISTRVLTWLWM